MKVDDDTFVNLPLLFNQLKNDKKIKDEKCLLMGFCFCGDKNKRRKVRERTCLSSLDKNCSVYLISRYKSIRKINFINDRLKTQR